MFDRSEGDKEDNLECTYPNCTRPPFEIFEGDALNDSQVQDSIKLVEANFGRKIKDSTSRGFKVRIYPNHKQRILIAKTFGCCRKLYNLMLEEREDLFKHLGREWWKVHKGKTVAQYRQEYEYMQEVDSYALKEARENLITAFKNFFRGLKQGKSIGFPKFKCKRINESYTTNFSHNNIEVDFRKKEIKIPKVKWVKYRDVKEFPQTRGIKRATISRTKTGKYFLSFLLEFPKYPEKKKVVNIDKIAAYDMSAKEFLVGGSIHNINRMENPRFYRSVSKRTKLLHKNHTRTKKCSKNREKARLRLSAHYKRIYNKKKDWIHKKTRKLADKWDVVILEDLSIKNMQKFNKGIGKSVTLDFSWNQFKTYLKYKLEWEGKHYIEVGRFFPSSQLCSKCGYKYRDLDLDERSWECPDCGSFHNRDENASINILNEGIKILKSRGIEVIN